MDRATLSAVVRGADRTLEEVDGRELSVLLEEREAGAVGRDAVERRIARRRLRALQTERQIAFVLLLPADLCT